LATFSFGPSATVPGSAYPLLRLSACGVPWWRLHGEGAIRLFPRGPASGYGKRIANIGSNRNLDLAPDGRRFVVLMPVEAAEARESQSRNARDKLFDEVRQRLMEKAK
jgi:hypothetical protein